MNRRMLVTEEVYNHILTKIVQNEWAPGEKIPSEKKLCEMFNVSRISIRSVLQQLQAKGMIYTKQGIGSFVSNVNEVMDDTDMLVDDFTEEDITRFFEFRQAIEFKAIDLFTIYADDNDYKKLLRVISMAQQCNDDFDEICQCDYEFHLAILEGSKNKYLVQAMNANKANYLKFIEYSHKVMNECSQTWVEAHHAVYQSLVQNRPNEAKRITLENNILRRMLKVNKKNPAPELPV